MTDIKVEKAPVRLAKSAQEILRDVGNTFVDFRFINGANRPEHYVGIRPRERRSLGKVAIPDLHRPRVVGVESSGAEGGGV